MVRELVRALGLAGEREPGGDPEAVVHRPRTERPAECRGAFPHAGDPVPFGRWYAARGPVVVDLDGDGGVTVADTDGRAAGLGVPYDIGQRLLDDPVRRSVDLDRQCPALALDAGADVKPGLRGPADEFVQPGQPGYRCAGCLLAAVAQDADDGAQFDQRLLAGL